jgi:hypothetical protein
VGPLPGVEGLKSEKPEPSWLILGRELARVKPRTMSLVLSQFHLTQVSVETSGTLQDTAWYGAWESAKNTKSFGLTAAISMAKTNFNLRSVL